MPGEIELDPEMGCRGRGEASLGTVVSQSGAGEIPGNNENDRFMKIRMITHKRTR
jgi:hypothetical protein